MSPEITESATQLDQGMEALVEGLFYAMREAGMEMTLMGHGIATSKEDPTKPINLLLAPLRRGVDKESWVQGAKQALSEQGALWVAVMAEAYVTVIEKDGTVTDRKREVLHLSIESHVPGLPNRQVLWEIQGLGKGAKLGKPERCKSVHATGRFTNLLPPLEN